MAHISCILHGFQNPVVIIKTFLCNFAFLYSIADQTTGICTMFTVTEFAAAKIITKLLEAPGHAFVFQMP